MSPRSSRYSSPARRAARVSSVPPVAASWASRPLSAFSVEWNDDRVDPFDPLAVPAAVGQPVLDEPGRRALDVGAEPDAVRERPGVDAAVDLAAPVRQVVVLPAAVRGEALGGVRQHGGVDPPLAERVQRPRRRRPRLARPLRRLRPVEVEAARGRTRRRPIGRPGSCRASRRAPNPSVATRARVAVQTSSGAPSRSRSTCQRSAGSESSSQSVRARSTTQ